MAIIVENISEGKIIGFGDLRLLPGESKELPVDFEQNPTLEIYKKIGFVRVSGVPTVTEKIAETEKEDTNSAEELRKARLASLPGISEEDLGKLAFELGVNPAECKDQKDVLKKVKAALK